MWTDSPGQQRGIGVLFAPLFGSGETFMRFCFLFLGRSIDRIRTLETKLKALEDERARRSTEDKLVALRRHLNGPLNMFDRYEAVKLLQSSVRLARNEAERGWRVRRSTG